MSPQKIQALSKAYEMANSLMSSSGNPLEAIKKVGVTREQFEKMKQHLNNPMAALILNSLGVDAEQAKKVINDLENGSLPQSSNSLPETVPSDELSSLQQNLAKLKK